jgi:hypothetical protein
MNLQVHRDAHARSSRMRLDGGDGFLRGTTTSATEGETFCEPRRTAPGAGDAVRLLVLFSDDGADVVPPFASPPASSSSAMICAARLLAPPLSILLPLGAYPLLFSLRCKFSPSTRGLVAGDGTEEGSNAKLFRPRDESDGLRPLLAEGVALRDPARELLRDPSPAFAAPAAALSAATTADGTELETSTETEEDLDRAALRPSFEGGVESADEAEGARE